MLEDTETLFRQLRRKLEGVNKAAQGTLDWEKSNKVRLLATLALPEATLAPCAGEGLGLGFGFG